MVNFKSFKKASTRVRQAVRKTAKKHLYVRRKYGVVKKGKPSTMGISKALSDLKARVSSMAEYKTIDENHTTGSPDVTLRQFYNISASAVLSTVSTTTTPGTTGYYLKEITMPSRGDGLTNFDGKRYHVSSIQWKGTVYNNTTSNETNLKMYIIKYSDEDNDPFQMSEFLKIDNNGEYSVQSKRNPDFKGYSVIASKFVKLSSGTSRRQDFNIMARPRAITKLFEADDTILSNRYYCLIVASSDINTTNINTYAGNTRLRFIA